MEFANVKICDAISKNRKQKTGEKRSGKSGDCGFLNKESILQRRNRNHIHAILTPVGIG